jgi:hypothetical protein
VHANSSSLSNKFPQSRPHPDAHLDVVAAPPTTQTPIFRDSSSRSDYNCSREFLCCNNVKVLAIATAPRKCHLQLATPPKTRLCMVEHNDNDAGRAPPGLLRADTA